MSPSRTTWSGTEPSGDISQVPFFSNTAQQYPESEYWTSYTSLNHCISNLEKNLSLTSARCMSPLWAPQGTTWWWPHHLSRPLIPQPEWLPFISELMSENTSEFQDNTAKAIKEIQVELVLDLEYNQSVWVLWKRVLNIARLLRFNICLLC